MKVLAVVLGGGIPLALLACYASYCIGKLVGAKEMKDYTIEQLRKGGAIR